MRIIGWALMLVAVCFFIPSKSALATGARATYGEKGVVVSCDQLASRAGVTMMAEGGNAVDAAVATAFALAVTCPRAGNLGGGGFAVIRTPGGLVITNDHREVAPAAAHPDMFLDEEGNPVPQLSRASHLAVGVPGSVAGLLDMLARFGKLSRKKVMAPAVTLAQRGFRLSSDLANQLQIRLEQFSKYPATLAAYTKQGTPYKAGEVLRQRDLAKTLKSIQSRGRSGFYTGKVAQLLVAEMERGGGIITLEDLADYKSVWRDPVQGSYRGYTVYSMGPPSSGGVLLIQMLNMLENIPVADLGFGSANLLHYMIETMRRSFANRNLADPDFYQSPVEQLTDKAFAKSQFVSILPASASASIDINSKALLPTRRESTETTHISVLDANGWAVSLTTTLNASYGVKIVAEGTGVLLNNEMDDFAARPNTANLYNLVGREANKVEPRKRMLSSMTPTIVLKDNQPFLVTGSPGGPSIITAVLQVIMNVIDHDMPLSQAVGAPRIHHQWLPDLVLTEPWGISPDTLSALQRRGHKKVVTRPPDSYNRGIGVVNSIMVLPEGGMEGVSDPRRAGEAVGF